MMMWRRRVRLKKEIDEGEAQLYICPLFVDVKRFAEFFLVDLRLF